MNLCPKYSKEIIITAPDKPNQPLQIEKKKEEDIVIFVNQPQIKSINGSDGVRGGVNSTCPLNHHRQSQIFSLLCSSLPPSSFVNVTILFFH